jgi:GDP-L-fucose synthase
LDKIRKFYKDKSVAVTGGAGMIGHQLVRILSPLCQRVFVIDDFSRGKFSLKLGNVMYTKADAGLVDACSFVFNRNRASVSHKQPVDVVFNLAAHVGGVFHNMSNQVAMFHGNIRLQSAPVLAAEITGVQRFVQVSSVCVYAEGYNTPCLEENGRIGDPHPSNGGYALSKRTGELVAEISSIPHVAIVRPGNAYGVGDYFDPKTSHVIPALIERALFDDEIVVRGSPDAVREFTNSYDIAVGMAYAGMSEGRKIYNAGSNGSNKVSMLQLAEKIRQLAKVDKEIVFPDEQAYGDSERWVSSERLMATGWKGATVDLDAGLAELIDWRERTVNSELSV